MKKKEIIYVVILILGFLAGWVYIRTIEKKIVFVKTGELFDGFEMKKELERSFISVQSGRKQQLDSLELELNMINNQIGQDGRKQDLIEIFEVKRDFFLQRKEQFEEDDALMQDQYTSKIKKQLNQYVADYGKEHNCDYILGAEGSGALMFAKDKDDVTKDVLMYINKKYKGIK